jgi:hypothetical protein
MEREEKQTALFLPSHTAWRSSPTARPSHIPTASATAWISLFLQPRLTSTWTKSVTYLPGTFCYEHARSLKIPRDSVLESLALSGVYFDEKIAPKTINTPSTKQVVLTIIGHQGAVSLSVKSLIHGNFVSRWRSVSQCALLPSHPWRNCFCSGVMVAPVVSTGTNSISVDSAETTVARCSRPWRL